MLRSAVFFFGVLCALNLPGSPALGADACAAQRPAPARIDVTAATSDQPPIDSSLSVVELTRMAHRKSGAQRTRGRVMGLTSADFRFGIEQLRLSSSRVGQELCVTPTVIAVRLQAIQRIHIVNSAKRSACWEESILHHERQHVRFNNDAVLAAARTIETELARVAARPLAAPDLDAAGALYGRLIDETVNEAAGAAFAEAAQRHAEIDTPKAYNMEFAAIRRKCGPRAS